MEHDPNAASDPDAGIFGLDDGEASARVVLVPVPYEATTSYGGGTSRGPATILEASHQIDLWDYETGRPYEAGIVMLDEDPALVALNREAKAAARDGGDVEAVNAAGAQVEQWVHAAVAPRLAAGKIVGIVGGDHSVPLGAIRAHGDAFGPFGILHIDAHADLREGYEGFTYSHASIMQCVLQRVPQVSKIAQVAIRDLCEDERDAIEASAGRVQTWFDPNLARDRLAGKLLDTFDAIVESLPAQVYVSFDIDGLDPKLCPNTGTPVPGGLDLSEVSMLLERVARSRRIIGFDLCEVGPGEWDGNVGARALYKLIGWTLVSQAAG